MVQIPLGRGAYRRDYSGEPEIRLENRFMEANPVNRVEQIALLARPGTAQLATFAGGAGRRVWSKPGLFGGDLFVCVGNNLYRYNSGGNSQLISGTINGTGFPAIAWMKGIGYEYLFIADGLLLQYYAGGSKAAGTLTLAGGAISTQVIKIGTTYYSWNASVDTNAPDGTASHPWLANPGTDPMAAMANLINFNGTRGTDFSTALTGPAGTYSAVAADPSATGTLTLSGGAITAQVFTIGINSYSWNANVDANAPDGSTAHPWLAKLGATDAESLANMVKLINFTGVVGSDYSTVLAAANSDVSATSTASTLVVADRTPGAAGNTITTTVFSGSFLAWGAATLAGGSNSASTMVMTASSEYTDGNAIATTVVSGSFLSWGAATLANGGTHALANVPVPDGQSVLASASVSSYVLASIVASQKFYWLNPGETTIDALNFATKESNPDTIIDMLTVGDQVVIAGDGSAENWYATGNLEAPFAPQEGRVYQRGVVEGTPTTVKDSVILVSDDGCVYSIGYAYGTTAQWGIHRISNHGIEERVRRAMRRAQGLTP